MKYNRKVPIYNQNILFPCLSQHHNHHEDRLWEFGCKDTFDSASDCFLSPNVNDFDQKFTFECPPHHIMTGMSSYHNNKREDRRWALILDCFHTGPMSLLCIHTGGSFTAVEVLTSVPLTVSGLLMWTALMSISTGPYQTITTWWVLKATITTNTSKYSSPK